MPMSFLFVQSISHLESGKRARGRLIIPSTPALTSCLIGEAVGQLAGWIAIERTRFEMRPVAGLVGECRIVGRAYPGEIVELAVEMESCDAEAASYSGTASVNGRILLYLDHCGAPMLPIEEFNDPVEMKAQFEALCAGGVDRLAFAPELAKSIEISAFSLCQGVATAEMRAPAESSIYDDHFPRRGVFPATLLLDAEIRLASMAARRLDMAFNQQGSRGICVRNIKLRAFICPGQKLRLVAIMKPSTASQLEFDISAESSGKRVASGTLSLERPPA
jgi:3-hydroxymyristoyl/3-hydroxydecanoyl-(acyl carrier protein) dehydratase